VITTFSSYDREGDGELTLSHDGLVLAYFNRYKHIAGFSHQEIQIERIELSEDRREAAAICCFLMG
jgi:hypothetical protein